MTKRKEILLIEKDIENILDNMANQIIEDETDLSKVVFIGILKRGDIIAKRVSDKILQKKNIEIPLGRIDINLYRDDLSLISHQPIVRSTEILFDINDKIVYLFDDIFFTGRTIRSALVEIHDIGRPKKILLYVLVDRKARELPIRPDFTGVEIETPPNFTINLFLKETDNKDLLEKEEI